jgi:predicted Zn-ribbon and HTH transcriptional regulator
MSNKKDKNKRIKNYKQKVYEDDISEILEIPRCERCGYSDIEQDTSGKNICNHCKYSW